MTTFFKSLAVIGVLAVSSGAASAATLSLAGGSPLAFGSGNYKATCDAGDSRTCYDPDGVASALTEDLTIFSPGDPTPGLTLSSDSTIRVTFLGSEAAFSNRAFSMAGGLLATTVSAIGASYQFAQAAGVLDFSFLSAQGGGIVKTASNSGTPFDDGLVMGFSVIDAGKSVYAFFDDSGALQDVDMDDMVVRIDVIPLPAAALPLLTALGALGFVGRRRRNAVKV